MNATEARSMTRQNQISFEAVLDNITSMCKAGYNYCCLDTRKITDAEDVEQRLIALGYFTEVSENYFNIKW